MGSGGRREEWWRMSSGSGERRDGLQKKESIKIEVNN